MNTTNFFKRNWKGTVIGGIGLSLLPYFFCMPSGCSTGIMGEVMALANKLHSIPYGPFIPFIIVGAIVGALIQEKMR